MTVQEDQFTGEDDQSLGGVAIEGLETTVEQLYQLAGIAAGWGIFELAGRIEGDTGLGGIGNHESDLWLVSQCHEGCVLCIGIQGTADDIDTLKCVHGLAVLATL